MLENAIATLKRYPEVNIEVAGHTDSRGSDAYNLELSARRAESVLKYLRDGGVTNTLTSRGYGETRTHRQQRHATKAGSKIGAWCCER